MENNINTELEKWVYLLSAETPEQIMKAATLSDEMFEIVSEVSRFCINIDEVMDMFSDILRELDRGTEAHMAECFKQERDTFAQEISKLRISLSSMENRLEQKEAELEKKDLELEHLKALIKELQNPS